MALPEVWEWLRGPPRVPGVVKFECSQKWCYNGNFVHFQCADVNFPCVCGTFYQLS